MKVIGMRRTEFTPNDSKEPIKGVNIYVTYELDSVEGMACERIFVSERKLGNYTPKLHDQIRVAYNRYGKVDSAEIVANGIK